MTCLVWLSGFVLIPDNVGVFHLEGHQLVDTWDGRLGVCLEAAVECGEVPLPGGWAARGSPGGGGAAGTSQQGEAGGCQLGSGAGAKRLVDLLQPCPFSPLAPLPGFTPVAPDIYASGWRSPLPAAPRPEGVPVLPTWQGGSRGRSLMKPGGCRWGRQPLQGPFGVGASPGLTGLKCPH